MLFAAIFYIGTKEPRERGKQEYVSLSCLICVFRLSSLCNFMLSGICALRQFLFFPQRVSTIFGSAGLVSVTLVFGLATNGAPPVQGNY